MDERDDEQIGEHIYSQMICIVAERSGVDPFYVDRVIEECVRYWTDHPNAMALVNAMDLDE